LDLEEWCVSECIGAEGTGVDRIYWSGMSCNGMQVSGMGLLERFYMARIGDDGSGEGRTGKDFWVGCGKLWTGSAGIQRSGTHRSVQETSVA
jgi:hypothetical protein